MALYLGSNLVDARIGASGAGSEYVAGTGINITESTISIDESVVAKKTDLPTKTSDLTNDSDFVTKSYIDSIFDEINDTLDQIIG